MKRYKNIPLWVYILAAMIPFLFAGGSLVVNRLYLRDYNEFLDDFQNNIDYAKENDCIRVEWDGQEIKLSPHNAQRIYNTLYRVYFSGYEDEAPEGESVLIDFGTGDIMKIWEKDSTRLAIQYIHEDGDDIVFFTHEGDVCRFTDIERLVSLEWDNSVWE